MAGRSGAPRGSRTKIYQRIAEQVGHDCEICMVQGDPHYGVFDCFDFEGRVLRVVNDSGSVIVNWDAVTHIRFPKEKG